MHEEGCAAVYVGLEQAHAFVRGVPAFYHDVVQLIAQKLVYHVLVLSGDFEEVGQRTYRSKPAAKRIGAQQLPYCVCRIAMLTDESLKRIAASGESRVFGTKLVAALFGFDLFCTLCGDFIAKLSNLCFEPLQCLCGRLELHRDLSSLGTQRFQVAPDGLHLRSEALRVAVERSQ